MKGGTATKTAGHGDVPTLGSVMSAGIDALAALERAAKTGATAGGDTDDRRADEMLDQAAALGLISVDLKRLDGCRPLAMFEAQAFATACNAITGPARRALERRLEAHNASITRSHQTVESLKRQAIERAGIVEARWRARAWPLVPRRLRELIVLAAREPTPEEFLEASLDIALMTDEEFDAMSMPERLPPGAFQKLLLLVPRIPEDEAP